MDSEKIISQSITKEYTKEAFINDTNLAKMNDNNDNTKKNQNVKILYF